MNVMNPGRALCLFALIIALIVAALASPHVGAAEAIPADERGTPLAEATDWVKVAPEGTTCWDGSPWHFWYHGGSADKLAVWFEGGGACWNASLCDAKARPSFQTALAAQPPVSKGVLDQQRKTNPLRDFSVVVLPYCTGDVHIGRRTVEYQRRDGTRFTFAHEGARNTLAAFDWLKSRGFEPRTLFMSGESSGAVAAAYWAVEMGDRWPQAQLTVLGDSAGGYRSLGVNAALRQWGVLDALPDLPAYAERDRVYFESFYIAAAQRHPGTKLGQVNFADDATQRRFMSLLGTPVKQLTKPLTCNLNEVRIDAPGFRSFIYPGQKHMILRTDAVYTTRCEGQSLVSWVDDLLAGRPMENRWCDGTTPALASPTLTPPALASPGRAPGL